MLLLKWRHRWAQHVPGTISKRARGCQQMWLAETIIAGELWQTCALEFIQGLSRAGRKWRVAAEMKPRERPLSAWRRAGHTEWRGTLAEGKRGIHSIPRTVCCSILKRDRLVGVYKGDRECMWGPTLFICAERLHPQHLSAVGSLQAVHQNSPQLSFTLLSTM